MIRVAVVGATGYTGEELVRLLVRHPDVQLNYVSGKEDRRERIQDIFPSLNGKLDLACKALNINEAVAACDCVFLSLPHTVSMSVAPEFLKAKKHVVDLSADYRFQDAKLFERYYAQSHADTAHLAQAVYGLAEWNREKIKKADFIANPGCYPTGALLGLMPLLKAGVKWAGTCVVDAKSGFTGAGRKAKRDFGFSEINENFYAYRVMQHQHEPEIGQWLRQHGAQTPFVFVPHLLPINRGILSTIYFAAPRGLKAQELRKAYEDAYAYEPFVNVLPEGVWPNLRDVAHTNQCHIGLRLDEARHMAVVVTAIDNLGKGAAGQAIHNFNLSHGLDETRGLQ